MYRIVSYEEFDAYPDSFSYFDTAYLIQQLDYPNYLIEYWDIENFEVQVVWDPKWEEGESNAK